VDDVVLRDCSLTWMPNMTTPGEDVGQVRTTNVKVERLHTHPVVTSTEGGQ
jgi:hypothetical protein